MPAVPQVSALVFGDVDGDTHFDLLIASAAGVKIYLNSDGQGTFTYSSGAAGDLDLASCGCGGFKNARGDMLHGGAIEMGDVDGVAVCGARSTQ